MLIAGASAALFGLFTTVLIRTPWLVDIDRVLSSRAQRWSAEHSWSSWLLRLLPIGEASWLVLVVGLVATMTSLARGRWRPLVGSAVTLGALAVLVEVAKTVVGRAGPSPSGRWPALFATGGGAFPSGHTAGATVGLLLVASLVAGPAGVRPSRSGYRVVAGAALLLAVGVGTATVLRGWHWPTDVAGGLLMAGVVAPLGCVLVHRRPGARRADPKPRRGR